MSVIPYNLLPQTARLFGFSTHVAGERMNMGDAANRGKARVMDGLIYEFTWAHNFGALLTRDSDFMHFAKNNKDKLAQGPAILFIPPSVTMSEASLIECHASAIRSVMGTGRGALYSLECAGLTPLIP